MKGDFSFKYFSSELFKDLKMVDHIGHIYTLPIYFINKLNLFMIELILPLEVEIDA